VSGEAGPWELRERLELWSALLLAAATVATAYSAYQSTRWSGEQSTRFTQAGAARLESAKAQSNGSSLVTIDAALFTGWAAAVGNDDEKLRKVYEDRFFRKEFRPAFEEWLESNQANNRNSKSVPFALDSYRPAELARAEELEAESTENFEVGREANQNSDNYVLSTIFFAAVLFFAGVATKFTSNRIVAVSLGVGTLVFLGGLVRLATLPFL
jgi:hypothetical protein